MIAQIVRMILTHILLKEMFLRQKYTPTKNRMFTKLPIMKYVTVVTFNCVNIEMGIANMKYIHE